MGTERAPGGEQNIDYTVANEARVYDYLLGGKTNFAIDREVAHRQGEAVGGIDNARAGVRANRVFLREVVRWLVEEGGVRQFLDIGSGIPTQDNVHQVAQRAVPESRVFYTDYDPIVMTHAHEVLKSSTAEGAVELLQADFREPATILARAEDFLDFREPVALLLVAFLHFIGDDDDPHGVLARLLERLAPGSYLAVSHLEPEHMSDLVNAPGDEADYRFVLRTRAEVERFFEGLEPVQGDGCVMPMVDWLPPDTPGLQQQWARGFWTGLGRKP